MSATDTDQRSGTGRAARACGAGPDGDAGGAEIAGVTGSSAASEGR